MNKVEWHTKHEALTAMLHTMERHRPACKSCAHQLNNDVCGLYQAKPPEEVRAIGCDSWEFDGIPF